jgi:hypothetical protein
MFLALTRSAQIGGWAICAVCAVRIMVSGSDHVQSTNCGCLPLILMTHNGRLSGADIRLG